MGGIIRDFLGGMGDSMALVGKAYFQQSLQDEMNEANHLRNRALQDDRQTFEAGQNDARIKSQEGIAGADRTSREGIAKADRESSERVAGIKASKKQKPQLIKYTDSKGYEHEGVLQEKTDGSFIIVKPDTDQVLEDQVTYTTEAYEQASREYDQKASPMKSDNSQFGMSEKRWKEKRAIEITLGKKGKSSKGSRSAAEPSGGVVGSASGGNEKPETKAGDKKAAPTVTISSAARKDPAVMFQELRKKVPKGVPDEAIIKDIRNFFKQPDWTP